MPVPTEMSPYDLMGSIKDIRETVELLDKVNAIVQLDADIHDGINKLMKENFSTQHEIVYLLNGARNRLSEYADILDRISRSARIPWPPMPPE